MEREYNVGTWLTPSDEYIKDIKQTLVEKGVATELTPNSEIVEKIKKSNFLKPFLDIKKSMEYEFYNQLSLTYEQLIEVLNFEDTSNVSNMRYAFEGCSKITSIPLIDTANVENMFNTFKNCYGLISIPPLDVGKVGNLNNIFTGCSKLENILMYGMKENFSISASTKFTREALVTILNNLATVTLTKTLTMGSTNLAKLTDEDKTIATNKGWTLA